MPILDEAGFAVLLAEGPEAARRRPDRRAGLSRAGVAAQSPVDGAVQHRGRDRGQVRQPDDLAGQPAQRRPPDQDRARRAERHHRQFGAQRGPVRRRPVLVGAAAAAAGAPATTGRPACRSPGAAALRAITVAGRAVALRRLQHQRPAGPEQPADPVGEHRRRVVAVRGQLLQQLQLAERVDHARRTDGSTRPAPRARWRAAVTSESASLSGGSSTTMSSVAWPSVRSTMSTLRMSAPACPAPSRPRPGRRGGPGVRHAAGTTRATVVPSAPHIQAVTPGWRNGRATGIVSGTGRTVVGPTP